MKILQKPNATVGQIVKDLEQIVARNQKLRLEYSNDDGNDMFVEGIKLRKDIAILETTGNKKRAATVEDILAMFRMLDASLSVVLQDGWELLNFEPNEDGTIFRYDDEDDCCLFLLGRDVRLITTQQIETELKKIDEEGFLNYEVVPLLPHGSGLRAYRANCLRECYGKLCLCYDKAEKTDSITMGQLLEQFPVCAEFMVKIDGRYYTVDINKKGIFCSIARLTSKSLFTIHVGEVVYDPMEEIE